MQNWRKEKKLYDCDRDENNNKKLDYENTYIKEFLNCDPLRDWESIDRCKELWGFFLEKSKIDFDSGDLILPNASYVKSILDVGTKDGQFVEYLEDNYNNFSIGIEIDERYVKYAQDKDRNVIKGDVCNLKDKAKTYDIVFSHHVLGLCPDYQKALKEMMRVTKKDGYIVTCNDVPGNSKKHYSLVNSIEEMMKMISKLQKHKIIYCDYWNEIFPTEYLLILKRM